MSLPAFKIQSLSSALQHNTPVTWGQPFRKGDFPAGFGLRANGQDLQVDAKVTYPDGSVKHAILSGILPSITAAEIQNFQLALSSRNTNTLSFNTSAKVDLTLAGVNYVANLDSTVSANKTWLSGHILSDMQFAVPFVDSAGVRHPHLMARFGVRDYGVNQSVRVTIENNWSYIPGAQNFFYDVVITLAGKQVFSKTGLRHFHHARWTEQFWVGEEPKINVQLDKDYLISTGTIPPLDTRYPPSEDALQRQAAQALNKGPMKTGLSSGYFPTTGGNEGIGIIPAWQAAWVLSGDARARDASLVTADCAGSFSIHYRNEKTDNPISLSEYPYMTLQGNYGDTWNPATGGMEWFAPVGTDRIAAGLTDDSTDQPHSLLYTADIAHQPSLAYVPYLLTGEYYYLEELKFWGMFDTFISNPNYRGRGLGLVTPGELRAQAWALRTLAEGAAIAPDNDPQKAELIRLLDNNLNWYNEQYVGGPRDNQYGVVTHGMSFAYGSAIAPWMSDFFVSAVGHVLDLGFTKAAPLLQWLGKFPVQRMTAEGCCWQLGAPYALNMREGSNENSPLYGTLRECYVKSTPRGTMDFSCAGPEMSAAWHAQVNDMGGISDGYMGYPSNMQPALAYAVQYGVPGAKRAWDLFMSRAIKPDYSYGGEFSISPLNYVATYVGPTYIAGDTPQSQWNQIAIEGQTVTVPSNTTVRFGADTRWVEKVATGRIAATVTEFGNDPAPGTLKTLQQFIPSTTPIEEPKMTFKVSVKLSYANQTLPHGTEAQASKTLVEILAADGSTVVASSTDAYEFGGVNAGSYVVRASGIDSKGAVMGVPYTQAFTIVDEIVTPPEDTTPVEVSLPAGITVSYVKE